MLKYKNLIKNDEFIKTLFLKSIYRKIGFFGGFSYGINQNTKINNIEVSGFGSGMIYGLLGITIMSSPPLWILTNIYFFHNYRAFIIPNVILKKYKPKCEQNNNNNNNNESLFFAIL